MGDELDNLDDAQLLNEAEQREKWAEVHDRTAKADRERAAAARALLARRQAEAAKTYGDKAAENLVSLKAFGPKELMWIGSIGVVSKDSHPHIDMGDRLTLVRGVIAGEIDAARADMREKLIAAFQAKATERGWFPPSIGDGVKWLREAGK